MAPGRPFTRDTTICGQQARLGVTACTQPLPNVPLQSTLGPTSPFSRGTMREYSVVQMTSSSCVIRSSVRGPNRSRQSLLEAAEINWRMRAGATDIPLTLGTK